VEIVGSGFVPGIVFNTRQRDLIYARTDIGGAYRWNPATSRWIPLLDWVGFDDWNLTGVDSLATDPVDPNRVYVLAGTYTNAFTTMNGAILRSTDQGTTWQRSNLPFKSGGNMPGRSMGERLAIDPNRDSILYLGTRSGNGLWRSTDFGATWARVASFPAVGTYVQQAGDAYLGDITGVVWVTFDPRSGTAGATSQTIYVGVADKASSIYRSTDGGVSWSAVPGQPNGFLPPPRRAGAKRHAVHQLQRHPGPVRRRQRRRVEAGHRHQHLDAGQPGAIHQLGRLLWLWRPVGRCAEPEHLDGVSVEFLVAGYDPVPQHQRWRQLDPHLGLDQLSQPELPLHPGHPAALERRLRPGRRQRQRVLEPELECHHRPGRQRWRGRLYGDMERHQRRSHEVRRQRRGM
jgi:hypothetical protein